jgi:hypothetical protein
MTPRALAYEDYLPLRALYARFDAMAEGATPGNSTAAHQAVLDRLAANQRLAESLGWTECALERQGGRGRLLGRGVRPSGADREVIPDWVPGRLRSAEHEAAPITHAAAASDPSSSALADREHRDELKAIKAGWLSPASPLLTEGMFERVAKRLAASAFRSGSAATSPGPIRRAQWGASVLGVNVECAAEGRWLDDGGR